MTWNPDTDTTITVHQILDLYPSLGIPHFQRGLVWDTGAMALLLESLYLNTPCGSIVLWNSVDNAKNGIPLPEANAGGIRFLIVDGQQRIRSLYGVFRGNEDAIDENDDLLQPADGATGKDRVWCINLTKVPEFGRVLKPFSKEYGLFLRAVPPENAKPTSPLKKNILPIAYLLDGEDLKCDVRSILKHEGALSDGDLARYLQKLRSDVRDMLTRKLFVTKVREGCAPAEVIELYNRINSSGKRVEAEERAFARLVSLHASSWDHIKDIFERVHGETLKSPATTRPMERDDVLQRQKENRFGFKLFIRAFVQVSNYHLCRSVGSQYLSFNVVDSGDFERMVQEGNTGEIEFLWKETGEILVALRKALSCMLMLDDLAFLPDTTSLAPVLQLLVQYPELRHKKEYMPVLGWMALSLLIADLGTDTILEMISEMRNRGEVAEHILPGMLKDADARARKLLNAHSLKDANSVQDRYVLLLYGLLRRRGIRDFSYADYPDIRRCYGESSRAVCAEMHPEKQHIAPFSLLVERLNDPRARRSARHRFNNIGNLTYISSKLNGLSALSDIPIDRSKEDNGNLRLHYLREDGSSDRVGHHYDEVRKGLLDEKGDADIVSRHFDGLCGERQQLIADGFRSWLDDLGREAMAALNAESYGDKVNRMEAVIPRCVETKYLPLTQRVRRMNYPDNAVEDAVVACLKDREQRHEHRRKNQSPDVIELWLSRHGPVKLLVDEVGIRVDFRRRVSDQQRAAVMTLAGKKVDDTWLYRRDAGGAVTLRLLQDLSRESVRLEAVFWPSKEAGAEGNQG